jgi:thymidine phosphorylase
VQERGYKQKNNGQINKMLLPQELIRHKRDGQVLNEEEINAFVEGITEGQVGDAQIAALTMAICCCGMNDNETAQLTLAMTRSGKQLSWAELAAPVLDKHSSGGVGDLVSLVLAPIVAASGIYMPMISGRGLGHTGGTLDKLESIPGYNTSPSLTQFRRVVREQGFAIIGQTMDLAPADKRMSAIRDVTATVESDALITASILSKKLSAGLDGLVMDIKFGSGAFLPEITQARQLAEKVKNVAELVGLPATSMLTDMSQPLAPVAGNALEVMEAVRLLRGGDTKSRSIQLILRQAAEILWLGGMVDSTDQGYQRAEALLTSGQAAERFAAMVQALGGPSNLLQRPEQYLKSAPYIRTVSAPASGVVQSIATRVIGLAVVELGGGRTRADQQIDHRVGINDMVEIGSRIRQGDPLACVHAIDESSWQRAAKRVLQAYGIGQEQASPKSIVKAVFRVGRD